MDLDSWENLSMEEDHAEFSRNHLETYHAKPHKVSSNEYIEKKCCGKLDVMQSVEYQSRPSSSHIEVPYGLELLGDYATSYHLISLNDQYDDVVSFPHLFD